MGGTVGCAPTLINTWSASISLVPPSLSVTVSDFGPVKRAWP